MNTRELEEYITNRFRIQQENVKYDDSFFVSMAKDNRSEICVQ